MATISLHFFGPRVIYPHFITISAAGGRRNARVVLSPVSFQARPFLRRELLPNVVTRVQTLGAHARLARFKPALKPCACSSDPLNPYPQHQTPSTQDI